jgi:CDP-6-deoxy-D-xylo-4-hexulose-3-dehydrase
MTTIEGGMVCTDDEDVYETLRMLRSHGMVREASLQDTKDTYKRLNPELNSDFIFFYPAYNMRNNEIGGILGRKQLPNLDNNVILRNRNHQRFLEKINKDVYQTDFLMEGSSNYAFQVILKEPNNDVAERLMNNLRDNSIEFRRGSAGGGNQVRQPYIRNYVKKDYHLEFPNTEHIHFYGFYIGNFPSMSLNEVDEICEVLNKV